MIFAIVVMLLIAVWVIVGYIPYERSEEAARPDPAEASAVRETASSRIEEPEPPARPATVTPAVDGLHVLCPLPDGGAAHLLLTAQTYYRAVTVEEEARLTELYGPPVTNVDPNNLPVKSPLSVTEALAVGPRVFFVEPLDGAVLRSPIHVKMDAEGVAIQPAGVVRDGVGHFHITVDAGCVTPGEHIPLDATRSHYGKGEREGDLELSPGQRTLCLQLGDGNHTASPITQTITVMIRE